MHIAVMGATGRTGARIAGKLLAAGIKVRALGRSHARLAGMGLDGALQLVGEPTDADYLREAFRGMDAVYALLPYDVTQPGYLERQARQGEAMARAIRESGVKRVVFLSSLGAEQDSGVGMIGSMHDQEQRLRAIEGIDVTFLRPAAFMENFAPAAAMLAADGVLVDALLPELAFPMVATRDIADAAVAALADQAWKGMRVCELQGPRDLSAAEAVRAIGVKVGRPDASYLQQPYEVVAGYLFEAGFAADVAALTVDIARAINEGRIVARDGRTPQDAAATHFEDFCWMASHDEERDTQAVRDQPPAGAPVGRG